MKLAYVLMAVLAGVASVPGQSKDLRLGMVGLDTGHVVAFTRILHNPKARDHVPGTRVVGAVKIGSPDVSTSILNVDKYTEQLRTEFGVTIYDSIEELARHVDAILIESVDGRPHLAQARVAIAAGKPLYIEKPLAASVKEGLEILALAKKHQVPVFSSSALRFGWETQAVRNGKIGRVLAAETTSPAKLEPHHMDLFWYGVHGVESLFTVMGTGIESVTRKSGTGDPVVVEGVWRGGRSGVFREAKGYGGWAKGTEGESGVGESAGYGPLVAAIVTFFQTGVSPVPPRESIEILAFMEADYLSKQRGGQTVTIAEVMKRAGAPPEP